MEFIKRDDVILNLNSLIKDKVSESLFNEIIGVIQLTPTSLFTEYAWRVDNYLQPSPHNKDAFVIHHSDKTCMACSRIYTGEGDFCPFCGTHNSKPALEIYHILPEES